MKKFPLIAIAAVFASSAVFAGQVPNPINAPITPPPAGHLLMTTANPQQVIDGGTFGTLANKGTGISVVDPGTGLLETVLPVQTTAGASKVFAASDLYKETRRSNSGSAMSDTFPASTATSLVNGTRIVTNNVDSTANDTITAGAGTTINSGATVVIGPLRSVTWVYDAPNTMWRSTLNGTTAVLSTQALSSDLSGFLPAPLVTGVNGCGQCFIGGGSAGGNLAKLQIYAPDVMRMKVVPFAGGDLDFWSQPAGCGSFKVQSDTYGSNFNLASPHGCGPVTLNNASISGTTLTFSSSVGTLTPQGGQYLTGSGVTANTYTITGSGTTWTVNNSQTVGPITMTAASTSSANLILRPPNVNEAYYQFAVSNNNAISFETGGIFASPNSVVLRNTSNGGQLTLLYAGPSANAITFPAGTTDFGSTGGTSQVLRQSSLGAAFTVGRLATSDLSDIGTFNLSTTGTALIGSNGQVSIFSNAGSPTITSDASHNLTVKSGVGSDTELTDSKVVIGSSQTNFFNIQGGSGDPFIKATGGNLLLWTAGSSKFIWKNDSGQGMEMFSSGGNNIRTFTGTNPTINTSAGNLTLSAVGGQVVATVPVRLPGYTVSTLPAGTIGMRAYVTDAVTCTFQGALTGGGSTYCPVSFSGTSWIGG